jgi:glc operon protein GlcG
MQRSALVFLAGLAVGAAAFAQSAPTKLTADTASQIINGCVQHAKAKGQSHAIAVVDAGGHLLAFLRMDGNPSGIGDFALEKAKSVASWQFSTAQMQLSAQDTPGFANAPHVVTVPGGLPAFSANGEFLGAVGASGEAPSDDASCVEAGITSAGFLTARPRRSP